MFRSLECSRQFAALRALAASELVTNYSRVSTSLLVTLDSTRDI
jgi:hypothetical protein